MGDGIKQSNLVNPKKNGVNLTQREKEVAVLTLLTRATSAHQVADQIGVSRKSLYNY